MKPWKYFAYQNIRTGKNQGEWVVTLGKRTSSSNHELIALFRDGHPKAKDAAKLQAAILNVKAGALKELGIQ